MKQLSKICLRTLGAVGLLTVLLLGSLAVFSQTNHGEQATASFKRGKILFDKGNFKEAIVSYDRALELEPNWAEAHVQRGYARRMNHELDKALEDYDKASELDPRTTANNRVVAQAYTNHGQVLSMQLKLDEAITDFNKAIKSFRDDQRPVYERAQARLLLDELTAAIADYDAFIAAEKHDSFSRARAFAERGIAKHLLGREDEARKDVRQSLELAGESGNELMMHLALLDGRLEAARQLRTQKGKIG